MAHFYEFIHPRIIIVIQPKVDKSLSLWPLLKATDIFHEAFTIHLLPENLKPSWSVYILHKSITFWGYALQSVTRWVRESIFPHSKFCGLRWDLRNVIYRLQTLPCQVSPPRWRSMCCSSPSSVLQFFKVYRPCLRSHPWDVHRSTTKAGYTFSLVPEHRGSILQEQPLQCCSSCSPKSQRVVQGPLPT